LSSGEATEVVVDVAGEEFRDPAACGEGAVKVMIEPRPRRARMTFETVRCHRKD